MKAISSLATFTGRVELWRQIRQQHGLQWSTGIEKIDAFTRFFDNDKSLDVMLEWLKEAVHTLDPNYANLLLFCTLTGMRGSEAVESIRLLASSPIRDNVSSGKQIGSYTIRYYDPGRKILQHYLYPNIFIRRTKAIYIPIVNDEIIGIAQNMTKHPSLAGLKKQLRNRNLSMHIKYCRKIFASYLKQYGIETEIINMLQGRRGKDIFLRHYYTPSINSYRDKVLGAVSELQKQITK